MAHRHVRAGTATAGLAALLITGCALSESVGSISSISDSASSPFEWSSSISGGASTAYQQEIREQVLAFAESGGNVEGFQRELGDVAKRHGVLNWEVDPVSFQALGQGLREAGFSGTSLELMAEQLTGGDDKRKQVLLSSYDAWSGKLLGADRGRP